MSTQSRFAVDDDHFDASSACPVAQSVDPLSAEYLRDPYPLLHAAREQAPVVYAPRIDMWLVTRYADIKHVFSAPETFSASIVLKTLFPLRPEAAALIRQGFGATPVLGDLDPPAHAPNRARLAAALSPRRIAALEPIIRERVEALMDRFEGGRANLVSQLSFPLPALTIFSLLGFPEQNAEQIKAWCQNKLVVIWGRPAPCSAQRRRTPATSATRSCAEPAVSGALTGDDPLGHRAQIGPDHVRLLACRVQDHA